MFEPRDKVRKKTNHEFDGVVWISGPARTIVRNKYGRDVTYLTDELELVPAPEPPMGDPMFEPGDKVRKKAKHEFVGSVHMSSGDRTMVVKKCGRVVLCKTDELELIHAEEEPKDQSMSQKTKRVRIAVAMGESGSFYAVGFDGRPGGADDHDLREAALECFDCLEREGDEGDPAIHFVEADVPITEPTTIEGVVKP